MQAIPKVITVAMPGADGDAFFPLEVFPGDTPRDIKRQYPQLRDHSFFRHYDSLPYKEDTKIYTSVRDGDQIFATSYQDVGHERAS